MTPAHTEKIQGNQACGIRVYHLLIKGPVLNDDDFDSGSPTKSRLIQQQ